MQTIPYPRSTGDLLLQSLIALDPLVERIRSLDSGSDRWEDTKQITDQARIAIQAAIHQDVLEELIYAHKIIIAALSVMDAETTSKFMKRTADQQIDGDGATRAHERLAVIRRADGGSL